MRLAWYRLSTSTCKGKVSKTGIIRDGSEVILREYGYDQAGNRNLTRRYFTADHYSDFRTNFDQNGKVLQTQNGAGLIVQNK